MYKKILLLIFFHTCLDVFCEKEHHEKSRIPFPTEVHSDRQYQLLERLVKAQEKSVTIQEQLQKAEKERRIREEEMLAALAYLALAEEQKQIAKAERQKALKEEANKPFSITECLNVFVSTLYEEFNLRQFSLDVSVGIAKHLTGLVKQRAISTPFEIANFALGDLPARHIHPNAGIYPMDFLELNFNQYRQKRRELAEQQDPRFKAAQAERDRLYQENNVTPPILDAQARLERTRALIEEQKLQTERNNLFRGTGLTLAQLKKEQELETLKDSIAAHKVQQERLLFQEWRRTNKSKIELLRELNAHQKDEDDFNPNTFRYSFDRLKREMDEDTR